MDKYFSIIFKKNLIYNKRKIRKIIEFEIKLKKFIILYKNL